MTFQVVPDTAAFVIEMGVGQTLWSNTFYGVKPGYYLGDMEVFAHLLYDVWGTNYMPLISDDYTLNKVTAYDLRADGAPMYVYTDTPVPGGDTASALPIQDALVLTLYTQTRGRSGRGRLYLAGFTEGDVAVREFTTACLTAAAGCFYNVVAQFATAGWTWSVVSRYHNNVKRAEGVTMTITSYLFRSAIPGNQQRRSRRP